MALMGPSHAAQRHFNGDGPAGVESGACWRWLRDWHQASVWQTLHGAILVELGEHNGIDWEWVALDSAGRARQERTARLARIRRIAVRRARSAMSWPTVRLGHLDLAPALIVFLSYLYR